MILISVAIRCNLKILKISFYLRSNLFTTLSADAVLSLHQSYTETKFNGELAKFLKYAPERVEGGGRKEKDEIHCINWINMKVWF